MLSWKEGALSFGLPIKWEVIYFGLWLWAHPVIKFLRSARVWMHIAENHHEYHEWSEKREKVYPARSVSFSLPTQELGLADLQSFAQAELTAFEPLHLTHLTLSLHIISCLSLRRFVVQLILYRAVGGNWAGDVILVSGWVHAQTM